jgi:hypothetical protein
MNSFLDLDVEVGSEEDEEFDSETGEPLRKTNGAARGADDSSEEEDDDDDEEAVREVCSLPFKQAAKSPNHRARFKRASLPTMTRKKQQQKGDGSEDAKIAEKMTNTWMTTTSNLLA